MAGAPDTISLQAQSSAEDGSTGPLKKGIFTAALTQVQRQVHPNLTAKDDAVDYIEHLIGRLLMMLCQSKPHTVQDMIDQVSKTFPNPIDKWAMQEAQQALEKKKKDKKGEKGVTLPAEKVHPLLKEMLGYKIDQQVSLYIVAVLEYVAADIWKLAGIYVKNIRLSAITCQDVKVAMSVDKVLMNMFFPGDDDLSLKAPEPESPKMFHQLSLTYEDRVRDLILEETQFTRELNMIIKVFRSPFVELFPRSKDLDVIFSNIVDIHEFTVDFLGSLEDIVEVTEQNEIPLIGGCFEEMAEAAEFDVYEKYMDDVMRPNMRDRLNTLLQREDTVAKLQGIANGFKDAVKYVLPRLLLGPIGHLQHYFEVIRLLKESSPDPDDQESFQQAEGLLHSLRLDVERRMAMMASSSADTTSRRRPSESWHQGSHRGGGRQSALQLMTELQKSIEGWEGKDIDQCCNEYIMEGGLLKHHNKKVTERYVFLLDGLIILCKQNPRKSTSTQQDYRLKEKYSIRRIDIVDREDSEELKFAFEVHVQEEPVAVLSARTADDKSAWMAALLLLLSRSTLERTLDTILTEDERMQPLLLPPAAEYEFAVEDSDENILLEETWQASNMAAAAASSGGDKTVPPPPPALPAATTPGGVASSSSSISGGSSSTQGPPLIRGATLVKLVERVTYHMNADPKLLRVFLTTYRSFTTPQQFLELLMRRYRIPSEPAVASGSLPSGDSEQAQAAYRESLARFRKGYVKPVQFRVLNVIRHWVDHHYYDFQRDVELLRKLEEFLDSIKGKAMQKWVESILKTIKRKQDAVTVPEAVFNSQPPPVEWHLYRDPEMFDLMTLHPIEIARQETLLEFEYYRAVQSSEMVGVGWMKEDKETISPNLLRLITHTTKFTFWLEKNILETKNYEERQAVLSRVVELQLVFLELNNFNGAFSIYAALKSAGVFRLWATYEKLPSAYKKMLEENNELFNDHSKKYIEKLRSINPPCVPFLGLYLTNIVKTEEGNPDFLPKAPGLINFNKRRRVAEFTGEIQQYQNQPYNLQVVPEIKKFLQNLQVYEGRDKDKLEDYLYALSLEIEPKNVKVPKYPRRFDFSVKSPGIKPSASSSSASSSSSGPPYTSTRQSSFASLRSHLSPFAQSPSLDSIPAVTKAAFSFKNLQDDEEGASAGAPDTPPTPGTPKTPPVHANHHHHCGAVGGRADSDESGTQTAIPLGPPPPGRRSTTLAAAASAASALATQQPVAMPVVRPPPLPPRRLKSVTGMSLSAPLSPVCLDLDGEGYPPPALPPKPREREREQQQYGSPAAVAAAMGSPPPTELAPPPPLPPRRQPKPYLSRHSIPHVERHTTRRNSGEHVNVNGVLTNLNATQSPSGSVTPQLPPRTYRNNHARQKSQ